jgi:hypothetical protein
MRSVINIPFRRLPAQYDKGLMDFEEPIPLHNGPCSINNALLYHAAVSSSWVIKLVLRIDLWDRLLGHFTRLVEFRRGIAFLVAEIYLDFAEAKRQNNTQERGMFGK